MSALGIFLVGIFVFSLTLTAVILVGIKEAEDPAHSRWSELSEWERNLVEEKRKHAAPDSTGGES